MVTTYKSEHTRALNGAQVEVSTVTYNGQDFTALGSVVDWDRGEVCGYVKRDAVSGALYLTTWDGVFMFITLFPVSRWRTPRSFVSSTMTAYRACFGGFVWYGRSAGEGMFLRLKRGRAIKGRKVSS